MAYDPDKYHAAQAQPSQARGKERVRVILSAALELFGRYGIENVTTNDIAKAAGVPIGSLYRYFPNRDAIVSTLVELYIADLSRILKEIGDHPLLPYMSWNEVLLVVADSWVNYAQLNGHFALLYMVRASPQLKERNREALEYYAQIFHQTLQKRCPYITAREAVIYFQLLHSAVELGVNEAGSALAPVSRVPLHHEAVEPIAAHLIRKCLPHEHS